MGAKVARHGYTLPQTPPPAGAKGVPVPRAGQHPRPHRNGVDGPAGSDVDHT